MATRTAYGDRSDDHQFAQVLDVGEFCNRWLGAITSAKNLLDIHFGHASRSIVGVVIGNGVNHQAFQHALHFALDLIQQQRQFAGFDKVGDIVIGMKTFACCFQAIADGYRDGYAFLLVLICRIHKLEFNRGVDILCWGKKDQT